MKGLNVRNQEFARREYAKFAEALDKLIGSGAKEVNEEVVHTVADFILPFVVDYLPVDPSLDKLNAELRRSLSAGETKYLLHYLVRQSKHIAEGWPPLRFKLYGHIPHKKSLRDEAICIEIIRRKRSGQSAYAAQKQIASEEGMETATVKKIWDRRSEFLRRIEESS